MENLNVFTELTKGQQPFAAAYECLNQYDNNLRRLRIIDGMRQRVLQGEWLGRAPLGYSCVLTANGKKTIVVNKTGKLLRKAFLWKANEGISMVEIVVRLKLHGLKVTKQAINKAFTNPFYYGILSHSILKGEVIEGKHERLVSKEIFLKANEAVNLHIDLVTEPIKIGDYS